jgi:hypothetical protein
MSIPRFIWKTIVTEIPNSVQISSTGQTVPAAGSLNIPRRFNIQIAAFLNPFGLAAPSSMQTIVAGGHVIYAFVHFLAGAGGGGLEVDVEGNAFEGGGYSTIGTNITGATITAGNAGAGRYADGGAAWDLGIVIRNTGATDATGVTYSAAVRAY